MRRDNEYTGSWGLALLFIGTWEFIVVASMLMGIW